jgi:hypothetical protein
MNRRILTVLVILTALCSGCISSNKIDKRPLLDSLARDSTQLVFWRVSTFSCGQAFAGSISAAPTNATVFTGKLLVMHVRNCSETVFEVPFFVGESQFPYLGLYAHNCGDSVEA